MTKTMKVRLEYWNSKTWVNAGEFHTEQMAWASLGQDILNYRTVDQNTNKVLTDLSTKRAKQEQQST